MNRYFSAYFPHEKHGPPSYGKDAYLLFGAQAAVSAEHSFQPYRTPASHVQPLQAHTVGNTARTLFGEAQPSKEPMLLHGPGLGTPNPPRIERFPVG